MTPLWCGTCGDPQPARPPQAGYVVCPRCLDAALVERATDTFAIRVSDLMLPPQLLAQVRSIRAQAQLQRVTK